MSAVPVLAVNTARAKHYAMQRLRSQFAVALILLFSLLSIAVGTAGPGRSESLVELLQKPGHVAFMRHAWAPFEGAPKSEAVSAETLGPCGTQRNLDDKGRADARRLGDVLRQAGVMFDAVYTSKWCRCRETAELITGTSVDNLPLINSFYTNPDKSVGPKQIAALKRYLNEPSALSARMLMVTHGSLITALTGIDTNETEIVIVKPTGNGGIEVVGRGTL